VKFVSTRVLRNRPGEVQSLVREDDVVLTANGKPIAILIGVDEDQLDQTAEAVRQVRARLALSRLRRHAAARGLTRLRPAAIGVEIRAARAGRNGR
jgi:antitoxin (DNA-binding transcriptional repressor) of toxin-antitoxin stability system